MADWSPRSISNELSSIYLASVYLSVSLVFCMSVLCCVYLHISYLLSFVHEKHLYMHRKLCFIESSINDAYKIIIWIYNSRHFLIFKHNGRILPSFHFHPHHAYVSETVNPSLKLLGKIIDHYTIGVTGKFL